MRKKVKGRVGRGICEVFLGFFCVTEMESGKEGGMGVTLFVRVSSWFVVDFGPLFPLRMHGLL